MKFRSMLYIAIGGEDREIEATVEGCYSPFHRARVPRGENIALEPDDPEQFEVDAVWIDRDGIPLNIMWMLTDKMIAGLADEGITDAREWALAAKCEQAEVRRDDLRDSIVDIARSGMRRP